MNTQVFVLKNAAINQKASPESLTFQEAGIYAVETSSNDLKLYTDGMVKNSIAIYVGKFAGGAERSNDFRKGGVLKRLVKFPYQAPEQGQIKVTMSTFGAANNDEFVLKISHQGLSNQSGNDIYTQTYIVTGIFANAAALYTALEDKIAADPYSYVTTSSSGTGLLINTTQGQQLKVSLQLFPVTDISYTVNVTTEKQVIVGNGSIAQVIALAKEHGNSKGKPYEANRAYKNTLDNLTVASNCHIYMIQFQNPTQPKGDHGLVFDVYDTIFLCVPTAMTVTTLETLLASGYGGTLEIASMTNDNTTTAP